MGDLPAWALANTVSAYAIVLAGLLTLALTALMAPQPRRWWAVYAGVLLTGIPTVWHHGFGETLTTGFFDIGTNLLLAWLIQVAVLGDYYSRRTRRWVAGTTGTLILLYLVWKLAVGPLSRANAVSFGDFGGFHVGEVLLILNSFLGVGLLYARLSRIPPRARPLLYLVTGIFLLGLGLATASNQQVDFRILAYHATWHIVSAFGFVALWAFNQARFG